MPTITGSITISDLLDGVTGVSVIISNESHTFIADADGQITVDTNNNRELDYETNISVFAGSDEYSFITSGDLASSQWEIGTITATPSGHDLTFHLTDNGDDATLKIRDANTATGGFVDANTTIDSVTVTVPVTANIAGTEVTVNKTISLTKAKGGDAKIVRVGATTQSVEYAFGATQPKGTQTDTAVVLTATTLNFGADSESTTWTYSVGGSSTFNAIDSDAGTTSGSNTKTLTVSKAQYDHAIDEGTEATVVTYRATAGSVFDQVSVFLLRDAEGGYSVIIEIDGGVQVFKNDPAYSSSDATTYANLKAFLFRGGVDITSDSGVTFAWSQDGTALTASTETALLGEAQPSGYGRTTRQIRVGANAIDDNGSNRFSCAVTF